MSLEICRTHKRSRALCALVGAFTWWKQERTSLEYGRLAATTINLHTVLFEKISQKYSLSHRLSVCLSVSLSLCLSLLTLTPLPSPPSLSPSLPFSLSPCLPLSLSLLLYSHLYVSAYVSSDSTDIEKPYCSRNISMFGQSYQDTRI